MSCSGLRFLVVEDHDLQRQALVRLLQTLGAQTVHGADDGRAALQVLRDPDRPVDIVVSDLSMPGMDGMELMRHLSEKDEQLPLIVVSALDDHLLASIAHMAEAYKVKLLGVISKPPTARKLVSLIAQHRELTGRVSCPDPTFSFEQIAVAWQQGEFAPWFQPRVQLSSGKVIGMSAVPRWQHPAMGVLEQHAFLPSVTALGLGDDFAWLMIQKCAAACRRWVNGGVEVPVAVTLSVGSLSDADFALKVRKIATNEGLEPRLLTLGVREELLAKALQPRALENMARLRMDGFGLAIDAFGAGSLAIEELALVAFTEVRIDSSFVTGVHQSGGDRAGLAVGLQLAQELKLKAVADGITTRDDCTLVREWGCEIGQGPFISAPIAASDVPAWVRSWSTQNLGRRSARGMLTTE